MTKPQSQVNCENCRQLDMAKWLGALRLTTEIESTANAYIVDWISHLWLETSIYDLFRTADVEATWQKGQLEYANSASE